MTSTKINNTFSWWNDLHFVPSGFFIVRTGLTRHFNQTHVTAGYGYGKLPLSADNKALKRTEHRPWAQIQHSFALPYQMALIGRLRYDARFRQDVSGSELLSSYTFTNRVRFMITLRKFLTTEPTTIGRPFVGLSEELLLNFGSQVTFNRFDQNRVSLMLGTQYKNIQLQVGYMNRLVKTGENQFVRNNTLVIWITHQLNLKVKSPAKIAEHDGE
jgi:hypothetical protein